MLPPKEWISAEAVAPRLGFSSVTVRKWAKNHGCPHRRRGRGYQFRMVDVVAWLKRTGRWHDTGGGATAIQRASKDGAEVTDAKREAAAAELAEADLPADGSLPKDLSKLTDQQVLRLYNQARMRKESAQAGKAELDRQEREGVLVRKDEMRQLVTNMAHVFKAACMVVPARAAKRLGHVTARQAEIELEREMRAVLKAVQAEVEKL